MQGKAIQTSAPGVLCELHDSLCNMIRIGQVQHPPGYMSAANANVCRLSPMMEVSLQAYSYNMPRPLNDDIRLFMFLDQGQRLLFLPWLILMIQVGCASTEWKICSFNPNELICFWLWIQWMFHNWLNCWCGSRWRTWRLCS